MTHLDFLNSMVSIKGGVSCKNLYGSHPPCVKCNENQFNDCEAHEISCKAFEIWTGTGNYTKKDISRNLTQMITRK